MELPYDLALALDQLGQNYPLRELQQAAQTLSQRYRSTARSGQPLLRQGSEAAAYALSRMPATYGALWTALGWALDCCSLEPTSLLDVGAGTGAATWAAGERLNLERITCLEAEPAMADLGRQLMAESPLAKAQWQLGDLRRGILPISAQLVLCAYVLNELPPDSLEKALRALWDSTEQLLLLVEPGTPEGSALLRRCRRFLLDWGATLAAPCPCGGSCPLEESADDWCHFACRVPRSKLHRLLKGGDAPYEDEKFCYLALCKGPAQPVAARILRHPRIDSGRVGLRLCQAGEGCQSCALQDCTFRKKDAAYKAARKAAWGDGLELEK